MKKNILLFGANSYIAKKFVERYGEEYNFHPVYRKKQGQSLSFDFDDISPVEKVENFAQRIDVEINAVLFMQGINPSMGVNDITGEHFSTMLKINLITPVFLIRALEKKIAKNSLILFFSSIAKKKGSYDPSYAAAKAGMTGLVQSLANAYPAQRFNIISLGLVEQSPVYNQMSEDFRVKHSSRMQNNSLIKAENIGSVIDMLINNNNINRADIPIDGGYD